MATSLSLIINTSKNQSGLFINTNTNNNQLTGGLFGNNTSKQG